MPPENCSENTPAIFESYPENSPKNRETPKPGVLSGFFVVIRGKCCPFFSRGFFRETVPLLFAVFQSSERESEVFSGRVFWAQRTSVFRVPKTATKSSLFLRLVFSEFDFCYGAFFRRVLRSELRDLSWMWFVWSGVRDLYGILYRI